MSYRAKQATVALNLLVLAMVGLLYRMDSADDHIADQKAHSEAKTSELTLPLVAGTVTTILSTPATIAGTAFIMSEEGYPAVPPGT